MDMPAPIYRWYFGAHGLKNLERNILSFVGVSPIKASLIGMVENIGDAKRIVWLDKLERMGAAGT